MTSLGVRAVGIVEVTSRLGRLLDEVENGAEVMITRQGKIVARLLPAQPGGERTEARGAAETIRARAEQEKLGRFSWEAWKAYRYEGRP